MLFHCKMSYFSEKHKIWHEVNSYILNNLSKHFLWFFESIYYEISDLHLSFDKILIAELEIIPNASQRCNLLKSISDSLMTSISLNNDIIYYKTSFTCSLWHIISLHCNIDIFLNVIWRYLCIKEVKEYKEDFIFS